MALTVEAVTPDRIEDLGRLFSTNEVADRCWCMWFIRPVKEFHAVGREGNRASFHELVANHQHPPGLLAYRDGEPVGWCAVGPRSRYIRALKMPTYRNREGSGDSDVWLVPCFFVRRDARRTGVTRALLEAAVRLAREGGATAIEGFPFAGGQRRSSGDLQVGFEPLFSSCGFEVSRTPSASRVIMHRELRS